MGEGASEEANASLQAYGGELDMLTLEAAGEGLIFHELKE